MHICAKINKSSSLTNFISLITLLLFLLPLVLVFVITTQWIESEAPGSRFLLESEDETSLFVHHLFAIRERKIKTLMARLENEMV